MPNTVGSLMGTLTNGTLSSLYTTTTPGIVWPKGTSAGISIAPPLRYFPSTTPLSALRLTHAMLMVCQECGDAEAPKVEKLHCEYCERSYDGSVSLRKVVIAFEDIGIVIQEGKCPDCGCHNMSRVEATRICKCGTPEVFYLPTYRDDPVTTYTGTAGSSIDDTYWIQTPSTLTSSQATYTTA